MPVPALTAAEWAAIRAVLPKSGAIGRPRQDDRQAVVELLFAEATGRFGRTLHQLYGRQRAGFLSVRRQRWKEAGAWDEILRAGDPAIARMRRREYGDSAHMRQLLGMSERA